jgi:type I restriction enzyme, R subunit
VEVPNGTAPLPVAVLEAKKEDDDPLRGMHQATNYAECRRFDAKCIFSTNGHRYAKFNKFTGEYTGPFALGDFPDHQRLTACYHRHTGVKLDDPPAGMLFRGDSPAYNRTISRTRPSGLRSRRSLRVRPRANRRGYYSRSPPVQEKP